MPRATTLSRRNVKGMGSMKKGNVVNGEMWVNIKRCYFAVPFTRGTRFNEKETVYNLGVEAFSPFCFAVFLEGSERTAFGERKGEYVEGGGMNS